MKIFVIGMVAFVMGYAMSSYKASSAEVTYSNKGIKTVVSTCEKDKDCNIVIGQECQDVGFKVVATDHDDMKTIITAECGPEKDTGLFSGK